MLWVVTEFVRDHCHKLLSGNHNHFLRSHRHVQDCDVAQVQSLRSVGVKKVMDHLLDKSESYAAMGHTIKDLLNRLDFLRSILEDGSMGDTGFIKGFTCCMFTYTTETEFDTHWLKAIETFG
ncbi:hypothetical protein Ddye_016751 [Dipteronia dyeriana]|uniref:Uncharacterized protein n=1 Tax=Dipteronia dyeriana TaxID=168575 RepID=A0AAD9X0L9_9ROSI|nr:hypothetical protein Ddye_016751 [Dipteronia dyeriana]